MYFLLEKRIFIRKVYVMGLFSLLFMLLTVASIQAQGLEGPAFLMPLASKSLILDIAAPGSRLVAVGCRGHVLLSEDEAQSWQQVEIPTRRMLTGVYFWDELHGWAVGHGSVILATGDGGKSWELLNSTPEEERPLFDIIVNDKYGFAIGAYAKFMTTADGGKTWQDGEFVIRKDNDAAAVSGSNDTEQVPASDDKYSGDEGEEDLPFDYHLNSIGRSDGGIYYIAAEAGYIFRSDDGGHTWQELPSPYTGSFYGVMPLAGDSLLIYGLRGHIFRSDDGGQNWNRIKTGTTALLTDAVKLADGSIAVTGMAGVILVSTDGGQSFILRQPDRITLTAVCRTPADTLVFGGERGFKSCKFSELIKP